jgi:hypothetical protein
LRDPRGVLAECDFNGANVVRGARCSGALGVGFSLTVVPLSIYVIQVNAWLARDLSLGP